MSALKDTKFVGLRCSSVCPRVKPHSFEGDFYSPMDDADLLPFHDKVWQCAVKPALDNYSPTCTGISQVIVNPPDIQNEPEAEPANSEGDAIRATYLEYQSLTDSLSSVPEECLCLAQYQTKLDLLFRQHARTAPGLFCVDNFGITLQLPTGSSRSQGVSSQNNCALYSGSLFVLGNQEFEVRSPDATQPIKTSSAQRSNPMKQNLERFHPGVLPPSPPNSKHFSLEPTTLILESTTPHEIGNSILDFFGSQRLHVASVTKVRPAKYTVRADVLEDGAMCSMKVRIYRTSVSPSYCALEFRRRFGCALAFQGMYGRACRFFAARFAVVGLSPTHITALTAAPMAAPLPLPVHTLHELTVADIEPLLEMLESLWPSLQAEAATLVCALAGSGCIR